MHPSDPEALDAAWLEATLRAGAFPAARVRALSHEIIGVGYGLGGTSARLTLAGDDVPRTLVAKWAKTKDVRAEAHFHDAIAPRITGGGGPRGMDHDAGPLHLARLFAHASADGAERGVLLFEDIAPARQGDCLVGASAEEADALVDAMATYHAAFWGRTQDTATESLCAWNHDSERRLARVAETLPRFLSEWKGRIPDAAHAFAMDLPKRMEDAYGELNAAPATLIHQDLHLDNVLFRADGAPVVLDWPSAARGPAARDFGHFLVEGLTPGLRRERQRALAERHAAGLAARGVAGYDAEALRRDAAHVIVILFGAATRWVAGPDHVVDAPRVPLLAKSLLRNTTAALVEGVA